ncbi:hypothetical protein [Psychrobacillus antarcticus]|uniref:hypothetical protein n=1 Tax=Psychrobacillus antarcticus TaxID=2879115 RepID=UPI002407D527|nr:hypothetical protein [Psychrobacillus antarcticus]
MAHNQQNLSPGTAYVRFMLGSVMTAYGTIQLIREPKSRSGRMLVLYGSMKVAEGATKFCPRKAMSTVMEKMMSETTTQGAQPNSGTTMNSGMQSNASNSNAGQKNGNMMQMVGNIAQKPTSWNSAQSMGGNQNSSGAGQNTMGTNAQKIGVIAQTVAPQVSQIVKDVASLASTQSAAGTNNTSKQATTPGGSTNKNSVTNGNANKKDVSANSEHMKSASNTNSNNKQATSAKGDNMTKSNTKPLQYGATNNSNLDSSVIDAISKPGQKNPSTPNILH